jgi:hypothetical protein
MGPDIVDVVLCTWSNVAIPAILAGCEMIPFCETRIEEVERIQAQISKFALGISSTCPNICAQTELGLKPFRQLLFERQLKFYFRALFLHEDRWVHQALMDHLSGGWASPYLMHISSIRATMGLFSAASDQGNFKRSVCDYFLSTVNISASSHQWILPVKRFMRADYVCENILSAVITEFKFECAGLGNKQPRLGHVRKPFCPVCPVNVPNTGLHLLFTCGSLSRLRWQTEIQFFVNLCLRKGFSLEVTYRLFVNGFDWKAQFSKISSELAFLMLRKKVKFNILIYKYHFQGSYQYSNRFRVTSMKYTGLSEILYIYIDLYTGPHHTISILVGKIYYIDHKIQIYYIRLRK